MKVVRYAKPDCEGSPKKKPDPKQKPGLISSSKKWKSMPMNAQSQSTVPLSTTHLG